MVYAVRLVARFEEIAFRYELAAWCSLELNLSLERMSSKFGEVDAPNFTCCSAVS